MIMVVLTLKRWHREIKKLLSSYKIRPAPLVIDVDQRCMFPLSRLSLTSQWTTRP